MNSKKDNYLPWAQAKRVRPNRSSTTIKNSLLRGLAIIGLASLISSALSQWQKLSPPTKPTQEDSFLDTDYPLRPTLEPWNISNSYPYPRTFSKNVTEGTWLRITTHPIQDEIVFDMLGDLYCMSTSGMNQRPARPFLQGIPYDKEAEFSPDGSNIVFTSDADFGVDNIWTLPYSTCNEMSSKSQAAVRSTAIQQTNSTFRFFSSPAFHPTLPKIIATKWYLTGRPNGAGEIWEFPLLTENSLSLPEHGGKRVIGRNLPASWPKEKYSESQLGAEQGRYAGVNGDSIIFTRNIRDDDSGKFSYNKDVHKGINAIFVHNTTSDSAVMLVDATPGGANMPRVSHDGKTVSFVRRVKEKSVLVLKDLRSGTLHHIWTELTYDVSMIPAFMGAYPNYGWSAFDSEVIIWSSGQIWKVPLKLNSLGERIASSTPRVLPFTAQIELSMAQARYSETNISESELLDEGRVRSLRGLRSNPVGDRVVFEAAGDTYVYSLKQKTLDLIPKLLSDSQYYGPSFINQTNIVIHCRWSDTDLTTFELVDLKSGGQIAINGIPRGRFLSPVISHGKIAFVRTGKDYMLGDVEETLDEGVWIGDIMLQEDLSQPAVVSALRFIHGSPATQDVRLDFKFAT